MRPKFDPKLLIAGVVIVLAAIFVFRGMAGGGFGGSTGAGSGASSTAQSLQLLDGSTVQVGGATGKPTVVRFFGTW